jgi:uncharacterized membrane protein YukC
MKEFFKNVFSKIKGWGVVIIAIIAVLVIIIPYFVAYYYMRKANKIITIYPEFSIREIKNQNEIDMNALAGGLRIGQEIVKKLKGN